LRRGFGREEHGFGGCAAPIDAARRVAYTVSRYNRGGYSMTETTKKRDIRSLFIDPEMIRKVVAETNARMGLVPDPTATAEKAREMMLAQGVRPEENLGSRGIIAARYGEDEVPKELQ
jgi:hypothetical protein